MPGAGPWQDERHRFRRGDKAPTLPPRGHAAPSASSRGGPGTGSDLRDLTSKDGDVWPARFAAGARPATYSQKGSRSFGFTSPFPFCTSATGHGEKNSQRAYVFRIDPDSCRKRAVPALTFSATNGPPGIWEKSGPRSAPLNEASRPPPHKSRENHCV
jgi:hypothetical protein